MELDHRLLAICRRRAFTHVEMVIVVLIMGILAAAAAPKFVDSLIHHRVESAARRLKADLEHLRQTARLTSKTQTMTFGGSNYSTDETSDLQGLDRASETYAVDLADPPYEIDASVVDFGNNGLTISFNAYGMPLDAGGEPLQEGDGVTLRANDHQRKIAIDALGNVSILPN